MRQEHQDTRSEKYNSTKRHDQTDLLLHVVHLLLHHHHHHHLRVYQKNEKMYSIIIIGGTGSGRVCIYASARTCVCDSSQESCGLWRATCGAH